MHRPLRFLLLEHAHAGSRLEGFKKVFGRFSSYSSMACSSWRAMGMYAVSLGRHGDKYSRRLFAIPLAPIDVDCVFAGLTASCVPTLQATRPATRRQMKSASMPKLLIDHRDTVRALTDATSAEVMGNNPPLTPCGRRQARHTAEPWQQKPVGICILRGTPMNQRHVPVKDWLVKHAPQIDHVLVSPFTRTLQTALPLAEASPHSLWSNFGRAAGLRALQRVRGIEQAAEG